jgi:LuxR family maltose regulon positive regulatory protein
MTPVLRIYGFGETRVTLGDRPMDQRDWGTARAKELLFYLLSYPHRSKEQIGSLFWPDLSAAKLRSAFHVTLYRLRRALNAPDCILFSDDRYYFNHRMEYTYDVQDFERLIAQAERIHDTDSAAYESCLKQAIALYRGDFLENLSLDGEDWHSAQSEALRRKYIDSLLALARLASRRGEYDRALEIFRRIARKDSYLEVAHRGIMEAYLRMGDRNAALRHYRDLEMHLQQELGVSPTTETLRLYDEIVKGQGEVGISPV